MARMKKSGGVTGGADASVPDGEENVVGVDAAGGASASGSASGALKAAPLVDFHKDVTCIFIKFPDLVQNAAKRFAMSRQGSVADQLLQQMGSPSEGDAGLQNAVFVLLSPCRHHSGKAQTHGTLLLSPNALQCFFECLFYLFCPLHSVPSEAVHVCTWKFWCRIRKISASLGRGGECQGCVGFAACPERSVHNVGPVLCRAPLGARQVHEFCVISSPLSAPISVSVWQFHSPDRKTMVNTREEN